MGVSKFTYANSKVVNINEETSFSISVNDLEEKSKFLYFRRGYIGEPGSACGNENHKIRKSGVTWELTDQTCSNGKPIWKISVR